MRCYCSEHHEISTNPKKLRVAVGKVCDKIKSIHKVSPIDGIVFCGSSGASVVYPVSVETQIPAIHVRKEEVKPHHGQSVEGLDGLDLNTVVIVDDFVHTGDTIKYIFSRLANSVVYRGLILYNDAFWGEKNLSLSYYNSWVRHIVDMPVYIVG